MSIRWLRIFQTKHISAETEHIGSTLAFHPAASLLILGIPKNFSLDVADIY